MANMFRAGIKTGTSNKHDVMGRRRAAARKRGALNDDDVNFIEEVWAKYDANDDGAMAEEELIGLMTDINEGIQPSRKEVRLLVKVADADKSGTIDKSEIKKLIQTWFVLAEEKNRKINLTNAKREIKQAFEGCMHPGPTDDSIVSYPGQDMVDFWGKTKDDMEANYSKGATVPAN